MTSGVDVDGECEKMCSLRGGRKKGTASADVIKSRGMKKKRKD